MAKTGGRSHVDRIADVYKLGATAETMAKRMCIELDFVKWVINQLETQPRAKQPERSKAKNGNTF